MRGVLGARIRDLYGSGRMRPQILFAQACDDPKSCPETGSFARSLVPDVKSLCHHDQWRAARRLVVPGVDLARSPRRRADGRESSRDVSRRARAPPLGCAAAVAARRGRTQRGRVGRCAMAASIGAPAVPRRRRGDDSAGSQSRRGPARTFGGRGGAQEAIAAQ